MVLPVHDINPTRRFPFITYLLVALNIAVFVAGPVAAAPLLGTAGHDLAACRVLSYFEHYGAEPHELLTDQVRPLAPTGAVATDPVTGRHGCLVAPRRYRKSPFLSVLTAMFVHGGWLHLLGNMLFLGIFGNNVEDRLGRLRFLAFYLFCGYVAAYGFSAFTPSSTSPMVGASGAIAGVLGAYLVLFPRAKVWSLLTFFFFLPVRLPAWLVLGSWFLLQYVYFRGGGVSQGGDVAYGAHVIGFLIGAALVLRLRGSGRPRRLEPRWGPLAGR